MVKKNMSLENFTLPNREKVRTDTGFKATRRIAGNNNEIGVYETASYVRRINVSLVTANPKSIVVTTA